MKRMLPSDTARWSGEKPGWAAAAAVWVLPPAAAVVTTGGQYFVEALSGGLVNPDSYMRLNRLRDIVETGEALSVVTRDGSGHGTVLHWSHLLDSLLCLMAWPLTAFMPMDAALHMVATLFGPLGLAALGYVTVWAAAPFAARRWSIWGAVLAGLSPAIAGYGLAGVVHHHVGAVIAAVASWGWAARIVLAAKAEPAAWRVPLGGGLSLGAWIGAGLWLTPETVPLTLLGYGALWLAWIAGARGSALSVAMVAASAVALVVATAAWLADPPAAGLAALEIDRISVVFAGLMLAIAVSAQGMWAVSRICPTRLERAAAAVVISGYCALVWVWWFRPVLFGPALARSEEEWRVFFGVIVEMMPVRGFGPALTFLATGAAAAIALSIAAARRRSVLLGYAAVCAVGLFVVGQSHVRFAVYPEAVAAVVLPMVLTGLGRAGAGWSVPRLAVAGLFLAVPLGTRVPPLAAPARAAAVEGRGACRVADAVDLLRPFPGAVVLGEVSDTPEILYRTQARTVGSLYHRNIDAYSRLRAAWRSEQTAAVPPEVLAAEASFVLACRGDTRSPLVADLKQFVLYDQVRLGLPPPWLRPVAENPGSGHVLYEVIR